MTEFSKNHYASIRERSVFQLLSMVGFRAGNENSIQSTSREDCFIYVFEDVIGRHLERWMLIDVSIYSLFVYFQILMNRSCIMVEQYVTPPGIKKYRSEVSHTLHVHLSDARIVPVALHTYS